MDFKGLFKGKGGNGAATAPPPAARLDPPVATETPCTEPPPVAADAPYAPQPAPEAASGPPPLTPEMLARIAELRGRIQLSVGQVVLAVMNLPRYRHQSVLVPRLKSSDRRKRLQSRPTSISGPPPVRNKSSLHWPGPRLSRGTGSLADLAHLRLEPLLRDRVAIAHRSVKADDGTAPVAEWASEGAGKVQVDEDTVAGIAIWATVSDAPRGCGVGIRSANKNDAKITEQVRAGTFPVRLAAEDWRSGETVWLLDVIAADRKQTTSVLANFRQLAGNRPVRIHPLVARLIEPEVLEKLKGASGAGPAS